MLCYILGLLVVKLTSNLGVFFEINCTFGLTHTLCEVDGRGRDHSLLLKNAAVGNLSSFTFRRSPSRKVGEVGAISTFSSYINTLKYNAGRIRCTCT